MSWEYNKKGATNFQNNDDGDDVSIQNNDHWNYIVYYCVELDEFSIGSAIQVEIIEMS